MKCYIATSQAAEAARRTAGLQVWSTLPSPGFENLKWLKPVYPGDTVNYRSKITAKRDLATRPGVGLLFSFNEGINQQGDLVFSFDGKVLAPKR
jgi:acyl dehydratase